MKIALIVGINQYQHCENLNGCVNDALKVKAILERNGDGSVNFDCKLIIASNPDETITRNELKDAIKQLFSTKCEIALFYFAGHGHIESTGGYLLTSDANRGDEGVSLDEIMFFANNSPSTNKIIILDSCHSGIIGNQPNIKEQSALADGITILTASTAEQYATEQDDSGVFTTLMIDALNGSAANLVGQVTPGSVYAHIDQTLGAWEQRPVFKTNVKSFVSLRQVAPTIELEDLRLIFDYFPTPGFEYQLDPTYEPELKGRDKGMPSPIEKNTYVFAKLQKFNRLNLLVPVGAPHMWNAAMESKHCKLTSLGEHYRKLVEKGRI